MQGGVSFNFAVNDAFKLFYVDILGCKIIPEIRKARQTHEYQIIDDNKCSHFRRIRNYFDFYARRSFTRFEFNRINSYCFANFRSALLWICNAKLDSERQFNWWNIRQTGGRRQLHTFSYWRTCFD